MRFLPLLVLVLFLAACQEYPVIPYENYTPPEDKPIRPDIPRTYEPEPEDTPQPEQPQNGSTIFLENDIIPGLSLNLPLGDNISEHHKVITSYEYPLLRHQTVRLSQGLAATYFEEIHLENSSGRIIFGQDDISEEIGTFLYFPEDTIIYEYAVIMRDVPFWQLEGREIQLLGHTYVIAEAYNNSLVLFGINIDNNLMFEDGDKLVVNGSGRSNTEAFVYPFAFGYRLWADDTRDKDGILLSPGESLVENLGWEDFASRILDIRYEGTAEMPATSISLEANDNVMYLSFDAVNGYVELPLLERDAGELVLGRIDEPLRLERCVRNDYCIQIDEQLMLRDVDGSVFLVTYAGVSDNPKELIMRSTGNRYSYQFLREPGKTAFTDIVLGNAVFTTRVGPFDNATGTANISIAPRWRWDDRIPLAGGVWIELGELQEDSLALEIVVPNVLTYERYEERTLVNISWDGDYTITVKDVDFVEDDDTEDAFGQTPYGVFFLLDKERRNLEPNEGEEVDILIPLAQSYGSVLLEG